MHELPTHDLTVWPHLGVLVSTEPQQNRDISGLPSTWDDMYPRGVIRSTEATLQRYASLSSQAVMNPKHETVDTEINTSPFYFDSRYVQVMLHYINKSPSPVASMKMWSSGVIPRWDKPITDRVLREHELVEMFVISLAANWDLVQVMRLITWPVQQAKVRVLCPLHWFDNRR